MSRSNASALAATPRFRAVDLERLIREWLPAVRGLVRRLEQGAQVAEIGCGLGAATLHLTRAFPRSSFVGFDARASVIEIARDRAALAGIADRARFEVASASEFAGAGYALVAHSNGLHGASDPIRAARHVRRALAPAGAWLLVERRESDAARLRCWALQGGFSRFRRIAQSDAHEVFEARA